MNFSALLSEACRQADLTTVKMTDPWLLTELEQAGRTWALDQQERFHAVPSFDMLRQHPDHRVLASTLNAGTDLRLLYGNTLDYLISRKVSGELSAMGEQAELEGAYPLDELSKLLRRAKGVAAADHVTALTMDLNLMFDQSSMVDGLTFGFPGLDDAISFLLPGEVIVWAARLGIGKSVMVAYAAKRWAQYGKKVLVVSCEMTPEQLMHRVYAMLGGFNPKLFRQPHLNAVLRSHMDQVKAELKAIEVQGGDIVFPRDRRLSISALETAIIEEEPDVILIDGLYLLKPAEGGRDQAGWEKTKESSNGVKQLALEYNLPIMATTQLKRGDKVASFDPQDIAYSDAIGQDADIVVALSRDEEVHTSHRLIAEVIKNRAGEQFGRCQLDVLWDTMAVVDVPWTRSLITLGTPVVGAPTP